MARENVEVIREVFRRGAEGDRMAVYDVLDPEVVWEVEFPVEGVHRGPEEVRRFFFEWVEAFEDYRAEAGEFIDAGEDVVVAVRHVAKGKTSGVDVDMQSFQVWTVRDGKVIRYRAFDDRQTALEAVGLRE